MAAVGRENVKVIVTGATGFIGTALCRELLQNGHEVIAVIRPDSKRKGKLYLEEEQGANCRILELSLDNLASLSEMVEKADVFYHLAWNGAAGAEREDFDIQYTNIGYTAAAVRAATQCGCKKFIGAGSQAEYGVVSGMAKEEETLPRPFMMYGAAKLAACHMGRLVAKREQISFVWPRIYSIYGVGENAGTLVSYVIDTLKKGGVPELSPCENRWNFMHITDCAEALRILGERKETEGIYHVASEDTRLLKEFVEEIRDIVSPGSALRFGAKKSDPERTFQLEPDTKRLKDLGFYAKKCFRGGIGEM